MNLFDSHSHLNDEKFDNDREEVIKKICESGVTNFITAGYSVESSKEALEIANKYDFIYTTAGISPNDIPQTEEELWKQLAEIEQIAKENDKKVRAIGEIGLDYYWNTENKELQKIENIMEIETPIDPKSKEFEKVMFIYQVALKEINTKLEILKDEFKLFYEYDLIDHINTRIKSPESITQKMKDKNLKYTYKEMIKNINDIAGIRAICPIQKDIYSIRNLITKIPGIKVLKEKDYVRNPKKSGYSSYHMILEVPITLSQNLIYVKVEVQIRTLAMDFWASIEHKMKYKPDKEVTKSTSKELVQCAKIVNKLDNKMMLLNT